MWFPVTSNIEPLVLLVPTSVTKAGKEPVPSPQFTVAEMPDAVSSGLGSLNVARRTVPVLMFSTAATG